MRVLINALSLAPPRSGVGWYTDQLCRNLEARNDIEAMLYWGHIGLGSRDEIDRELAAVQSVIGKRFARIRCLPRLQISPVANSLRLKTRHFQKSWLYHETNFVPRNWDFPTVVTIHDLSILNFPEYHPRERVTYMEDALAQTVKRARHIITISEFSKQEILARFHLPENSVTAIPLAVRPSLSSEIGLESALPQFRLKNRQFVLVVGNLEPRKNLSRTISAYAKLPLELKQQFPLVHVGPVGWQNHEIHKLISDNKEVVRTLGYVSEKELSELYRCASIFLYPSLYEGFGLPIIEAMHCGTPVITSNKGAMLETAANAAELVDPGSETAITDALHRLLTQAPLRQRLARLGKERALEFSWQKCAEQTLDVYRRVIA